MNSTQNARDFGYYFMDNELLRKENRELKRTVEDLVNQSSYTKSKYLNVLQEEKAKDEEIALLKKRMRSIFENQTAGITKIDLSACTQLYDHMETTLNNNLLEDFVKLKDDLLVATGKITNQTVLYESVCNDSKVLFNENSVLSSQILDLRSTVESVKQNNIQLTKQKDELEYAARVLSVQCDGLKHQLEEERTIQRKLELNISSNVENENRNIEPCSPDNEDKPRDAFKQVQPMYHSAGSTTPCFVCLEPPYGLMVKCRECGHEHHSVCFKKLFKTAGAHSSSIHKDTPDLFTCARCKKV